MNIIVVGCGKVGYNLVKKLNGEGNDIVVIDINPERITAIANDLDAKTITGNGVSLNTLKEADLTHADLLIAVTGSDEQNLLCCLIAKKAGKCKTIARVRNPIYVGELNFFKEELGLTAIINPEHTCANEIARNFQFPSAVKVDTFSKGRGEILHFKVTPECLLKDYALKNLRSRLNVEVLICSVIRDDEVIIPKGEFIFKEGDLVAFTAPPEMAADFFKKINIESGKIHSVMLVGGGNISYYLAKRLLGSGMDVKIIENDKSRADELAELLPKATIICGDGTDQKLLMEEGIDGVDGFVALTGMDEENILISLYAKKVSNAKVVTKINRSSFTDVLEDIQLDSIVYPQVLTADVILKYARTIDYSSNNNLEAVFTLEDGKAEAIEFVINEESSVTNTALIDLKIKKNILLACIIRKDNMIIPGGRDMIKVGDHVLLILKGSTINDIRDILEDN